MNDNPIIWLKVLGIAVTQGAITLTWVIYNLYFTKFLVDNFGFSQQLSLWILIIENILEAMIEPIFGAYSDRQKQKIGTPIPIINIGIILSSVLFLAIPAVVIFINPETIWRWLLPAIALIWASAMAIFRSPVMALLGNAAPKDKLPQAASILTLASQLIGSFKFDVYGIITDLGANTTFAIGSCSLLIAAAYLRFLYPPQISSQPSQKSSNLNWKILMLIGGTGISIGCGLRFFIPTINKVLLAEVGKDNIKLAMTLFFIIIGFIAVPAGKIANKIGNSQAMLIGLLTTTFFLQVLVLNNINSIIFLILIAIICGFSLILNGAIPFVLNLVPQQDSGLGIGTYFCGFGIAISLFEFIFAKLGETNLEIGSIASTIAFLFAFLLIAISSQIPNPR